MIQEEYDTYEEYEEAQEGKKKKVPAKSGGKGEVASPMPEPIVYHDAIRSFTYQYDSQEWWSNANVEYLTLGDLRNMFAAVVPFGVPDAMPVILDFLTSQGFSLQSVPGFREPVMPVVRKPIEGVVEDNRYITL